MSEKVGTGKSVTVAGYYKIENYSNPTGGVGYAYSYLGADTYNDSTPDRANTNGWVRFEYKIASTTATSASWVQFGFAGTANGTITLADVTVSDGTKILYSMASDADLVAGTYSGTKQSGIWYFSGSSIVVSAVSYEPYMRDIYMPTTCIINPPSTTQPSTSSTTKKPTTVTTTSKPSTTVTTKPTVNSSTPSHYTSSSYTYPSTTENTGTVPTTTTANNTGNQTHGDNSMSMETILLIGAIVLVLGAAGLCLYLLIDNKKKK